MPVLRANLHFYSWAEATQQLQEEVTVIEGQVSQLTGLVQQQDALNAVLKQRVQATGEAESRAKVPSVILLSHRTTCFPVSADLETYACCSDGPA